jgi:hypothetical protein
MDAVTKNMRGEAVVGYGWLHAVKTSSCLATRSLTRWCNKKTSHDHAPNLRLAADMWLKQAELNISNVSSER